MPKIGHLISKLQVGDTVFNNPEVWNSAHKIKKVTKKDEKLASIKANSLLNSSYRLSRTPIANSDVYVRSLISELGNPKFSEFAPWNTLFNKTKQIILFRK